MTPELLLQELAPQVLGAMIRRFRDFAAAEDATQEALLAASLQWPLEGLPDNPRGWLLQVASRRVIDYFRADESRRRREAGTALQPVQSSPREQEDDTLVLFFMCCHPSLTSSSAIALTLRAVGGLTTAEIASAFFVPEATMAQRIRRAKQTIKTSYVPFQLPGTQEQSQRLRLILRILYLIFNEGYQRPELSLEAIRLTRSLHALLPAGAEVTGVLALMLLTEARRRGRTDPAGDLIPLTLQNRSLWDRAMISEGVSLLTAALSEGAAGEYQLQAAIAAVHDEAATAEDTDWPQILALYDLLSRMSDSPMAKLNQAIAAAMVHGPNRGLEMLKVLDTDSRLATHHRLDAVRAHLLEMAGDHPGALANYRAAAAKTTSTPERNYLLKQADRLQSTTSPQS